MLSICHLYKTFRAKGGPEVKALSDVSFDLPDHGLFFLLGKSGSGKSTLLNVLGGLEKADSGEVLFQGKNVLSFSGSELQRYRREDLTYVFQKNNLLPAIKVENNLLLGGGNIEGVSDALGDVGLSGFEKRKSGDLSGGEEQRVAIARALLKSTPLVICDEPTGSLDSENAKAVLNLLASVSKRSLVLVASHDEESAFAFADGILRIQDGRIVESKVIKTSESQDVKPLPVKGVPLKTRLALLFSSLGKKKIRVGLSCVFLSLCFAISIPFLGHAFNSGDENFVSLACSDNYLSFSNHIDSFDGVNDGNRFGFHEEEFSSFLESHPSSYLVYGHQGGMYLTQSYMIQPCIPGGYDESTYDNYMDMVFVNNKNMMNSMVKNEERTRACFPLLAGKYPEAENELAIPAYVYRLFQKYGYQRYQDPSHRYTVSSYDSFLSIGPTLPVALDPNLYNVRLVNVVGIIETGMEESRYDEIYKKEDEKTGFDEIPGVRFSEDCKFGPYCCVMVSPSLLSDLYSERKEITISTRSDGTALRRTRSDDSLLFYRLARRKDYNCVSFSSDNPEGAYIQFTEMGEMFADYRFETDAFLGLDYSRCTNLLTDFSALPTTEQYYAARELFQVNWRAPYFPLSFVAVGNYVSDHGLDLGEQRQDFVDYVQSVYDSAYHSGRIPSCPDFYVDSPQNENYLKSYYTYYLASREGGYLENAYGELSGEDITRAFLSDLFARSTLPQKAVKVTVRPTYMPKASESYEHDVSVAGLSLTYDTIGSYPMISFGESMYSTIYRELGGLAEVMTCLTPGKPNVETVHSLNAFAKDNAMALENSAIVVYRYFGQASWNTLSFVFALIGGALGIIAAVVLLLVVSASSRDREREIHLRYSLGGSRWSGFFALISEAAIIVALSLVLAIPFSLICGSSLNNFCSSIARMSLNLFGFRFSAWGTIVLGAAVMTFLVCSIPALLGSRRSLSSLLKND